VYVLDARWKVEDFGGEERQGREREKEDQEEVNEKGV
jgi:hypothetical protein